MILVAFAALALSLAAQAQTRTRRTTAGRTPARRTAATAAPAAGGSVNLTSSDMALLIDGLNFGPDILDELASNAEERKTLAQDIKRLLAASAEARTAGYAERPDLKLQLELGRAFVIAQEYFKRRQEQAGANEPVQSVTEAEVDAFLKEPATAAQFQAFVEDYTKNGPGRGNPLADAQRTELGRQYARVMVGMRKGLASGLDRDRKTQLLVMLQQAKLLSGAYATAASPSLKATEAEVDAYISKHPEYDTKVARAKAEDILRRVRAGEDFAKLADEFTEDPSGRGHGGDLGWFGRGVMVKPFEDAAFALKPGEVSGIVESPFGFHIIKLEERRPTEGGAAEEVHARHILIGYGMPGGGESGRPVNPRDLAREMVTKEKRDRALDALAARYRVTVAEDYSVGSYVLAPGRRGPLPKAEGRGEPIRQTPLIRPKDDEPPPPPAPRPTPKPAPTPKQTPPA